MQRATSEFIRLAKAKAEDEKLSFSEALLAVARENPQLASDSRAEVIKPSTEYLIPTPERQGPQGPATAEFLRRVKAKTQEDGVTFSEALRSVARDRPILASDYRKEVTKSKF
jgi:hypothetical protein